MPTPRRFISLTSAVFTVVALSSGCASSHQLASSTDAAGPVLASAPPAASLPPLAPATDAAAVTDAPATDAPTDAPTSTPTTEAPTTTAAPTTTEAPTTTSTIPANIVPVPKAPTPIPVVGGRSGADTAVVQSRLLELGFWLNGADGKFGLTTKQAVMAFQKYVGLPADGKVDDWTAFMLTDTSERPHGLSDTGTLVEIDKTRQLLYMIVDGKTQWIFNTSTGNGKEYTEEDKNTPGEVVTGVALTPEGLFKVNRERPEGWWEGDLGKIYRPKYFRGGIAVHGSGSVPNYPASHGCVRVTTQAMDFVWDNNLMPMGVTVWVHT